jgi:hypothetical protein
MLHVPASGALALELLNDRLVVGRLEGSFLRSHSNPLRFWRRNQNGSFPRVVMRKISEYEQYAEECRQLARASTDPKYRATLEKMARAWEAVAEERRKRLREEGR